MTEPRDFRPLTVPPGAGVAAVVRWLIVVGLGLLAAGSVLWSTGLLADKAAVGTEFYCPMHPQVVQDHPGECPICHMTLVERPMATTTTPATASPAPAPSSAPPSTTKRLPATATSTVSGLVPVTLSFERTQLIGMKTAKVERRPLGAGWKTTGVVTVDERRRSVIEARFTGFVEDLSVGSVGEHVARDQIVARVYSPDVVAAEQELLLAIAQAQPPGGDKTGLLGTVTTGLVDAAKQRLQLLGVAAVDVDAIVQAGTVTRTVPIRAPAAGTVLRRNAARGSSVQPGMPLFEVADLGQVFVFADVAERDRGRIGPKAPVKIIGRIQTVDGVVDLLLPDVDTASRTQRARIVIDNKAGAFVPGEFVDVVLQTTAALTLVMPREALVDTGDVQYAFVDHGNGTFEPRAVNVGVRSGDDIEILSGLAEGDVVVTTGNFLVDSESRLQASLSAASAATASSSSDCERQFDAAKYPQKVEACRACEVVHRGMGTMVQDCKSAIAKPWR